MPPRGRKPTPNALHLVTATQRADRHGETGTEVEVTSGLPEAPAHLCEVARDFWVAVTAELTVLGLGFACDRWDVEHVALLYSRARRAEALMPDGGFYVDAKDAPRRHPAALEALQCRKELRVALEALGISASGRARLLGGVKPRVATPTDEFFGAKKYFTKQGRAAP